MSHRLRLILAPAVLLAAACGGDDDGGSNVDAAPAPATIVVSGKAETVSGTDTVPLEGATIAAFKKGDEATAIATTMSAADGAYSLTVQTGGVAIDGYLKGTSAGRLDTYLYPPGPLAADISGATMLIVSEQTLGLLGLVAGVTQDPAKGFVGVLVVDASFQPVAGATITVSPAGSAAIRYGVDSVPNANATATDASGTAFIVNANLGELWVDASMGATAFREHAITTRAGVVTTTAIQVQ